MCLSVLGVGSKNSPKTRKNTPKWVKISIFLPKSPQNPPENGFGGGSGQFSALISGKTSKIVVKFRGGGVLRIDPYISATYQCSGLIRILLFCVFFLFKIKVKNWVRFLTKKGERVQLCN